MSTKHFSNSPDALVLSALRAVTFTNPNTAFDERNKTIYIRPDAVRGKQVSIVTGGGSGHEPSFASYVGPGLLSAAVAGTIFASPSAEQIRRCLLEKVDPSVGVLVIVMNYTGDVLNFGMAVEKAKAAGVRVEMVVVGDDVGVGRRKGGKVGRRGIAGAVLVQKIVGALAATGASLEDVHKLACAIAENVVSIGCSLDHVHVPGRSMDVAASLAQGEVEIGMGIHNEPGTERIKADLPGVVEVMLKYMLDQEDKDRAFVDIRKGEKDTVLLVNNLGGVSPLEMGAITQEVASQLSSTYAIEPARILSGTFMTSLNGLGFSISLLKVADTDVGKSMLELLDAPADCTGWSAPIQSKTWSSRPNQTREGSSSLDGQNQPCGLDLDLTQATGALRNGLERVIKSEPETTRYDTVVGDGDCGVGLKRGAEAILQLLDNGNMPKDAALFLDQIIGVVEMTMDGTSGALYAIFLNALARGLRDQSGTQQKPANSKVWAEALDTAMESMSRYTPAKPGDRTLVDALAPFVELLNQSGDVRKAAQAAEKGATDTKGMKASLGRSVYVGGEGFEEVPDPGAYGLAQFLIGLTEGLN
ncbi:dihydroxyacetone kinase [Piedraia hortae CBS 480.64]|uniref:Dihydroxyacetone kinase n=1 Tax=Piedraia hortae CBS 480.64 TaxID=1314780 RepID=A0A6A7BXQ8_9PEZI|nr:dihydroxyacetone kinase [Piedraia hortae CBS 480.64]